MEIVVLIGRILYGLVFVGAGIASLSDPQGTVDYAASRTLKISTPIARIAGLLTAAGGLGVILGIWADLAALGLVVFLLITAFAVHRFWSDESHSLTQGYEISQFTKNLSMAGAGLVIFVLAGANHEIGPTITDGLFSFNL